MDFDIDRYLTLVGRLDDDDIDYDHFRAHPLDADTLRCLSYMHDVEHHTVCYLRDLLVTAAHDDPDVTSFLSMWVYEEFWHGEAIAKVLAAHGLPHGRERIAAVRHRVGRDRLRTFGFMTLSALTGHVATVALTWGAVNEWTTQAAYIRLATSSNDEVLADLLRRIARQEGRHIDFYASQAHYRLAESRVAQRWARFALRTKWRPVGSTIMPEAETAHMTRTLFADDEGRRMVERLDRRIHRLPGLAGLDLIASARAMSVAE